MEETRLWGFARDQDGAEEALRDIHVRELLISFTSRDLRVEHAPSGLWEIREYPPYFSS